MHLKKRKIMQVLKWLGIALVIISLLWGFKIALDKQDERQSVRIREWHKNYIRPTYDLILTINSEKIRYGKITNPRFYQKDTIITFNDSTGAKRSISFDYYDMTQTAGK